MASINTSATEPIYLTFRGAGVSPDLAIPASILAIIAWTGVTLNSLVLYITAKSSSLRGTANFLMALICALEIVHQTGHTYFLAVEISGTNFVSLLTADIVLGPMLFAVNANMMAMLCTGVDRLIAVALPLKHLMISSKFKWPYLTAHSMACIVYGLFIYGIVLEFAIQNPGNPTTGVASETLSGTVGFKFFVFTAALNFGCVCCYVAIWLLIRRKSGVSKETNTRLLRSLIIILSVNIGGYFVNLSIYQFLFNFGQIFGSPIRVWQLGFIAGFMMNIGVAANAPILYFNSVDYRRAFKSELPLLVAIFGVKPEATTTTPMVQVRSSIAQNTPTVNNNPNSMQPSINNLVSGLGG